MNQPKRIYLDTNHWIKLARVHYRKEDDAVLRAIYDKIKKSSETGKVIFPISFVHLEEIMINLDENQRNRLIDFMMSISHGWALKPYTLFIKKEIENAFFTRLGRQPLYDINSEIIGKGIPAIFGSGYSLVPIKPDAKPIPEEKLEKIKEVVESPEFLAKSLKEALVLDQFKKDRQDIKEAAELMESIRKQKSSIEDKDLRYRESVVMYFDKVINDVLAQIPHKYGIFKQLFFSLLPITRDDYEKFLESMPSTNVAFRLVNSRDLLDRRPVQTNDIGDINHLAGAIPYCDIVVAEKMFSNLAIQKKLDEKYGCVLLSSLKELDKYF